MLIYAIDDEESMLRLLHGAIAEAEADAEIADFSLGADALEAIRQGGPLPDVVFCDIEMPPPTGLEFAVALKSLSPDTKIVFVTGYSEYAAEAYRIHAQGYIMKPVRASRVREELDLMELPDSKGAEKLRVQCFGYFEVFWKDEPLLFSRTKTKELLAFLVDRRGSACRAEEVIAALYEGTAPDDMKRAKQKLRNLVNDLKSVLNEIGQGNVLLRRGSSIAIVPELLDCDYYRMLKGEMRAVNRFRGEYMEQYSWAEKSKGTLSFRR